VALEGRHDTSTITQFSELLTNESERIKKRLVKQVFSIAKDKQVERFIQNHHQLLIAIIDKLMSQLPESKRVEVFNLEEPSSQKLRIAYVALESLLAFVEKHFSRYIDLSAKIPESYRVITSKDFSEKLPQLIRVLKEKGLKGSVIKPLLESFNDFIEDKELKISFRKLIYLKELYNEIAELSESELGAKDLDRQVCISMIYINYNTPKFLNHCARIIKESYQAKASLSEQLEKLSHYLKLINQQQEKPGFSYKHSQKSLKAQLTEWVIEEIIFLERKQQLSFSFKVDKTETLRRKDFKIHTESSVPQVAYFVRILMETGLIKNQSTIDVIRFFSSHISTSRTETISPDSFRSKFYNTEHAAKEAVKEDVLKLLDHIKKSS
jgi:hypothetical protein